MTVEWQPGKGQTIIVNAAVCINCDYEVHAPSDNADQRECCPCGALAVYGGTVFLGREGGDFEDSSLVGNKHN